MPRYFIGIDVSTTASKALAIDESGTVVASHGEAHELSTPRPLWSEQDPRQWWAATCASLRAVLQQISADDVAAVGLTGQMHGLTLLDAGNQILRPAILWNDQRTGPQCAAITEQVGAEWLYEHIGSLMLPGFTAPKIAWVREHEPEVFAQAAHILLPKDYVRLLLTGAYVTDVSDGSGIALMDIGRRTWSDELLAALDIPRALLPELCEGPEVCARVSAAGAEATGLRAGTPVVGGAGDQPATAIGSGILRRGQTSITVGTSGVVFTANDQYQPEPDGRLHTFCHAVPGQWFHMGVMLSAAGGMRWLHDAVAAGSSYDQLSDLAAAVPRGADGLVFVPYLTGERHPHPDPLARGAFVGLTLRSGLGQLVRSVMEGVAFGLRDNLELLRGLGVAPATAAISGGASQSPVWRQILTDIAGIPLYTINSSEGAALGAAILAAVGAGAWPDVPSACNDLIRQVDVTHPAAAGVADYERLYPIYRGLYPALRQSFAELAAFEG
ncbi:xylulokinase [Kouleothrix sp.]|uniref:xylulokinase n=1 Tax=Kouleothrix sp. TaxID=2779161 RepID=UPI00391DEDBA